MNLVFFFLAGPGDDDVTVEPAVLFLTDDVVDSSCTSELVSVPELELEGLEKPNLNRDIADTRAILTDPAKREA